jgi:hypothetical protein
MDKQELKVGTYVELEHYGETRDLKKSMIIAKQHLDEDPKYYSKLYQAGLIDEPKAIELAKKYFGDNKQYYMESLLHTAVKELLSEYEWGKSSEYEFGQEPDWWKGQLAAEDVDSGRLEEPAIVIDTKTNYYYLASVDVKTKKIQEIHPRTKSKNVSDICRMKWIKMYKQIHELSEGWRVDDYKWVANPIQSCKR